MPHPYKSDDWDFGTNDRLFVLTGAGVSAESGVKTFRDSGGLWEGHRLEEVATPEGFEANPELVIDFYNQRRLQLNEVEANPAHVALGTLKKILGDRMCLVTQNVDDLHERGGYENVIHMHGELRKLRCLGQPAHVIDFTDGQNPDMRCGSCGHKMRPHIVWFGEIPFDMEIIERQLAASTHFLYVGTSSLVYPAAGFKSLAKELGLKVMCVNLEVDWSDPDTDLAIEAKAGETLPDLLKSWES